MRARGLLPAAALAAAAIVVAPVLAASITGTVGSDRLVGTPLADSLSGAGGADTLSGLRGHDTLDGGAGPDRLFGGPGKDLLLGGRDADALVGGPGADTLDGGPGADRLLSRDGVVDTVRCGAGSDTATVDEADRVAATCERVQRPPPPPPEPAEIVVRQSGFTVDRSLETVAAVSWGAVLQNTSPDEDAVDVVVVVRVVDAAGKGLISEEVPIAAIPAGSVFNLGRTLFVEGAPARVEVALVTGDSRAAAAALAATENVRWVEGFAPTLAGDVRNTLAAPLAATAIVSAVVFDGAGIVIGGSSAVPGVEVPPGGTTGFEILFFGVDPARIARVDVSVEPNAP
jgi:hypothetical protein